VSREDVLRKVRAALPADGALVEFATYRPFDPRSGKWGERRYVAYVLQPAGAPSAADLGDTATIDRLVAQLRRALARPTGNAALRLGRELDARLMQPIRPMLGEARHVLVSPEGALHLVPLAALRDEQERWLVERYTFTYLTTGRELLREPSPPARGPAFILADPDFAGEGAETAVAAATRSVDFRRIEFEPLPGTAEEAIAIAKQLPDSRLLTRGQATEAALKQVKGPRILHIASHAFFLEQREAALENPLLRSGLVLAGANRLSSGNEDGILTALEAASLDLAGTRLVVLSACETGLGDAQSGEGIYGLRRALVIAGAATQVMSLWKVADKETRDLMIAYYDRLGQGAGRSAALRDAQLHVLQDKRTSHPFFWAGFIASGDWRPLERAAAASRVDRP
jgi:CHAT domain-containing protein